MQKCMSLPCHLTLPPIQAGLPKAPASLCSPQELEASTAFARSGPFAKEFGRARQVATNTGWPLDSMSSIGKSGDATSSNGCVSRAVKQRMRIDATLSPAMLALRINPRNITNELRVHHGKVVSVDTALLKPRRRGAHLQEARLTPVVQDKAIARKIAKAKRREQQAAKPVPTYERVIVEDIVVPVTTIPFEMVDELPSSVADADEEVLAEDDEFTRLFDKGLVMDAYRCLQQKDSSGLPRNRVRRTLEAVGHMNPDRQLIQQIMASLPGSGPLSYVDFVKVVAAFQKRARTALRTRFQELDIKGSGTISVKEMRSVFCEFGFVMAPQAVSALLAECGVHSFQIDWEQFEAVMQVVRDRFGFSRTEFQELESLFYSYDQDGSGDMSADELSSALGWLGQPSTIKQAQIAMSQFDVDGNNKLCKPEFMLMLRWYREEETSRVREIFGEKDANGDGVMDLEELRNLFEQLGYTISPGILTEAIGKNKAHSAGLIFEEAFSLLQKVHRQEGFSDQELAEFLEVFHRVDKMGKGSLREFEMAHALNWFGYTLSRHRRAQLWCRVDVDKSGKVEQREFLKLLRLLREEEVVAARALLSGHSDGESLRHQDLKKMLATLGYAPSSAIFIKAMSSSGDSDSAASLHTVLHIIQRVREASVAKLRDNAGLSDAQVGKIHSKFGKKCEEGKSLDHAEVERLIYTLFPVAKYSQLERTRVRDFILDYSKENGGIQQITDVCWIVRLYGEKCDEEACKRESCIIEETAFTLAQVAQFREAFVANDINGNGVLAERDICAAFDTVMTLNMVQAQRLAYELARLGELSECVDFPQFLKLLKAILDEGSPQSARPRSGRAHRLEFEQHA